MRARTNSHAGNRIFWLAVFWRRRVDFIRATRRFIRWSYASQETDPFPTWRQVEEASIKAGFAKDGSVWGSEDPASNQAALGVLGGMVTVLRSADAKRAWSWMRDNAPQ